MSKTEKRRGLINIHTAVLALLAAAGLVCWVLQLTGGMGLANLNDYNTWGLYITGFMIFTGITAGSLMFTASAYLFQGMKEFKPYSRISAFVGAIGGVIGAGLFIFADLGGPERAWRIITQANLSSPLFWDTVILSSYVIIAVYFTRQLMVVDAGKKEEKSLQGISVVALIAGLMVMVTSFVFAWQVARPLWNNAVQPLSFLAAALVAALSLLIIAFALLNKTGRLDISGEKLNKLGKLAGGALLFELFVVLGETMLGLYAGAGEDAEIIRWLVLGKGAPFFWVELAALVAALALLVNRKTKTSGTVWGAGIALFAVFMIKYNLLQAQLFNPLITYPGPAHYNVGEMGPYLPSWAEIGLFAGIISLGALIVLIGLEKLNLGARPKDNPPEAKIRYGQGNVVKS